VGIELRRQGGGILDAMREVAILLVIGCGSVSSKQPDAREDDAAIEIEIDGPPPDAALTAFSAGTAIPELATVANEQDPTLTNDMLEIMFHSDAATGMGGAELWTATRTSAGLPFGAPALVPALNSPANEQHPWLSPDGLTVWFTSDRGTTYDIYVSVRATRQAAWSTPSLVAELSSNALDNAIAVSSDLKTAVIASDRNGSATLRDLFISTRATPTATWGLPSAIVALATAQEETAPAFARGNKVLYFARGTNLYVARGPGLVDAAPVTELNLSMGEGDPWVTDDERTIYFSRVTPGFGRDIYMATR
jgi:WD40-like Beta Propeller Repeat